MSSLALIGIKGFRGDKCARLVMQKEFWFGRIDTGRPVGSMENVLSFVIDLTVGIPGRLKS